MYGMLKHDCSESDGYCLFVTFMPAYGFQAVLWLLVSKRIWEIHCAYAVTFGPVVLSFFMFVIFRLSPICVWISLLIVDIMLSKMMFIVCYLGCYQNCCLSFVSALKLLVELTVGL